MMEPAPEDAPRLLQRDKEELDRAAIVINDGRPAFLIFICEERFRAAALAYLRTKVDNRSIPEPLQLTDGEHVLWVLSGAPEASSPAVRSLVVSGDTCAVFRALNWHREKLRRGTPVLLWLSGLDRLRELREIAPDAYSFRDVLTFIRGDSGVPKLVPESESDELRRARERWTAAKNTLDKLWAGVALAQKLRSAGDYYNSEQVIAQALAIYPQSGLSETDILEARDRLFLIKAFIAHDHHAYVSTRQAALERLAEREGMPASKWTVEMKLWCQTLLIGPEGANSMEVLRNMTDALSRPLSAGLRHSILILVQSRYRLSGQIREAISVVSEALSLPDLSDWHRVAGTFYLAYCRLEEGQFSEAEAQMRAAMEDWTKLGLKSAYFTVDLAECHRVRGELESARRILDGVSAYLSHDRGALNDLLRRQGLLWLDSGDAAGALALLCDAIHRAAELHSDGIHYETCRDFVDVVRELDEAARLEESVLLSSIAEIDVAYDVLKGFVGGLEPPWYEILFPGLRSELIALHPNRLSEAIELASSADELARVECVELVPRHARIRATHLLRAGRANEARDILVTADAYASEQSHLRELAKIRVLAIVADLHSPQVLTGEKLAALREALDKTGSRRIIAETLLDLACKLPPDFASPDPLALLDEAHALFMEMPMPKQEARCLEAMGDVLLARGKPAEAKRRYLTARRRLEHYGLGLRLPLLNNKLSALSNDPKETS